ncbi:class I SAM-dependent methyltransferase [Natronorarus salvus]|uniref:class I SAM-dependent methyltransferase n=1 Tax=Natronorarus salvus TaxID=3117733 RepID=UPI002F26A563
MLLAGAADGLLGALVDRLDRVNRRIEATVVPRTPDPFDAYEDLLTSIRFSRALHFGSGRDKHGFAGALSGEVVSVDADAAGLSRNAADLRVMGDGHRLPFADDTFDLVFSEFVFEHLLDPDAALREIDRVVTPGGHVVVLVPNPRHYYARIADHTPLWFHRFVHRLQRKRSPEEDAFPTLYRWGRYEDVTDPGLGGWRARTVQGFPGPTGYTRVTPFHAAFVLLDCLMACSIRYQVAYLAYYEVEGAKTTRRPVPAGR